MRIALVQSDFTLVTLALVWFLSKFDRQSCITRKNTLPKMFGKSRFSHLKHYDHYPRLSLQKTDGWPNCILKHTELPGRKSRVLSRTYQLNTGSEVETPWARDLRRYCQDC